MKRSLVLIFAVGMFFSASAFAALGNNDIEIQNLFGPPIRQGTPDKKGITTNVYQKGNYVIWVQFLKHLSLAESYTRKDQKDFSQKEIDAFLEGSSNGRPWAKDPNKQEWMRMDHKAKAWCTTLRDRPFLLIEAE